MLEVRSHWLFEDGKPVRRELTQAHGGAIDGPLALAEHYTAGKSLENVISRFKAVENKCSAHLIGDRDGALVQMVPFNRQAWHIARKATWKGRDVINSFALAIEWVNVGGPLRPVHGHPELMRNWIGARVPKSECVLIEGIWWHDYSPQQKARMIETYRVLRATYPTMVDIFGHEDVVPTKKDPGPCFPWDEVLAVQGEGASDGK